MEGQMDGIENIIIYKAKNFNYRKYEYFYNYNYLQSKEF